MSGVLTQIMKHGYHAPEILDEGDVDTPVGFQMNGRVNPGYHPAGLQVSRWWEGPGVGKRTYLSRYLLPGFTLVYYHPN